MICAESTEEVYCKEVGRGRAQGKGHGAHVDCYCRGQVVSLSYLDRYGCETGQDKTIGEENA